MRARGKDSRAGAPESALTIPMGFPTFITKSGQEPQDHRGVKRGTRPMLGFKSFAAAQDTLVGIELMHMIKKRQLVVEEGDKGLTTAEQFYALAA